MSVRESGSRVLAVLGPTNTGKTYLAIERMLGHASGMIGFPLRLLARENYDRAVAIKGAGQVALVTGEEKIVPPKARYFLCTAESMPLDRPVDFLAVDEIQMCADPERGHVFTDRLLRARGTLETVFLGAETVRGVLRRLVPQAECERRPRFSKLSYSGPKKLTRLAPRSAIVAFSASDVYALGEIIRRHRGGAAVVLGALSPRTRNAQVAMYQAGEVDFLVATDAIGMGLNMNVDHVAFAGNSKFDGHRQRRLRPEEVAQIAGRAGRYMTDGTFGTTAELDPFDPEIVEAVESHSFRALTALQWRNADLDFSSARALLASLEAPPRFPELVRVRETDDHRALATLLRDHEIAALARHPGAVRTLWEVCQIPDFRKTMSEAHARLLARIYRHLMGTTERLPAEWVADQLAQLDRTEGDIDTLMARIAHVRTWTYVSYRVDWLEDAAHWQGRARGIEDRLSDALHQRLMQRFVDRRATALLRVKDKDILVATVTADDEVAVEGTYLGTLRGFRFAPDTAAGGEERRALIAAANRALRTEIGKRVNRLVDGGDEAFALNAAADLTWLGVAIARLRPGDDLLSPGVVVIQTDLLAAEQRERVRERLARWVERHVGGILRPLFELRNAELSGPARGLVFQLVERLGSLSNGLARAQSQNVSEEDRKRLRRLHVRFGCESIYVPELLKPRAIALRGLLWSLYRDIPLRAAPAGLSQRAEPDVTHAFYEACGFRVVANRAIRVDALDRFSHQVRRLWRQGPFATTPDLLTAAGLADAEAEPVLVGLGYRPERSESGTVFVRARRRKRAGRAAHLQAKPPLAVGAGSGSPFGALARLKLTR